MISSVASLSLQSNIPPYRIVQYQSNPSPPRWALAQLGEQLICMSSSVTTELQSNTPAAALCTYQSNTSVSQKGISQWGERLICNQCSIIVTGSHILCHYLYVTTGMETNIRNIHRIAPLSTSCAALHGLASLLDWYVNNGILLCSDRDVTEEIMQINRSPHWLMPF